MRFINFMVGIVLPVAALTAWLWYGYQKTSKANAEEGVAQISFGEYVIAWAEDFAKADNADTPGGGVTEPADMLPVTPAGWTQRRVKSSDMEALSVKGLDAQRQKLLLDPAQEEAGPDLLQVQAAWDTPDGTLVAELVRYPDSLFESAAGDATLAANRAPFGKISSQPLLNIGGLVIREGRMLPQIPARVLRADLDGQVVLRVSAPKRMSDETLRAFFATLNVAAMNAALAAPLEGMGEVTLDKYPLAVVVSQMTGAEAAKLAEAEEIFGIGRARILAEREAARAAISAKAPSDEAAATVAEAPAEAGVSVRRGVKTDDPGRSSITTSGKGKSLQEDCRKVGGRKVCGVAAPQAE